MSPDEMVAELRAVAERESSDCRQQIDRWLEAAAVAIPVVLRAGQAGNVQCRVASREILLILAGVKIAQIEVVGGAAVASLVAAGLGTQGTERTEGTRGPVLALPERAEVKPR